MHKNSRPTVYELICDAMQHSFEVFSVPWLVSLYVNWISALNDCLLVNIAVPFFCLFTGSASLPWIQAS